MKKDKNEVFFGCVIDGVYKEFNINVTEEANEILKREEFYQNKYASAFSKEEQELSVAKKRIVATLRSKKAGNNSCLNLQAIKSYNKSLFAYTVELLSKIELEEAFSLPTSRMNDYFKGMSDLVKAMPELKEEFYLNQEYYEIAKENTMLLSDIRAFMAPIANEKGKYRIDSSEYVEQTKRELQTPIHVLVKKSKKIS